MLCAARRTSCSSPQILLCCSTMSQSTLGAPRADPEALALTQPSRSFPKALGWCVCAMGKQLLGYMRARNSRPASDAPRDGAHQAAKWSEDTPGAARYVLPGAPDLCPFRNLLCRSTMSQSTLGGTKGWSWSTGADIAQQVLSHSARMVCLCHRKRPARLYASQNF